MPTLFEVNDERARTAIADLDILSRPAISNLENLLRTIGQKYHVPVVAERYAEATTDDCARAAASNIELLIAAVDVIRGFSESNAAVINRNLHLLSEKLEGFVRRQPAPRWEARLDRAIVDFRDSELAILDIAGSALRNQRE